MIPNAERKHWAYPADSNHRIRHRRFPRGLVRIVRAHTCAPATALLPRTAAATGAFCTLVLAPLGFDLVQFICGLGFEFRSLGE